jgi:hypothetical protein
MARVEFFFVETKVFEGGDALGVVPGVGEQNAADVPEDGVNFGHGQTSC